MSDFVNKKIGKYTDKLFELRIEQAILLDKLLEVNTEILDIKDVIFYYVFEDLTLYLNNYVLQINYDKQDVEVFTIDEYEKFRSTNGRM